MSTSQLYNTAKWKKRRAEQLRKEPLCRYCFIGGHVTAASVADHIVPHNGDADAFWSNPLQSLCTNCHSSRKQSAERTGRPVVIFGRDGWPVELR